MSAVTIEESVDCEGACCCRCEQCKGVGYWSAVDAVFPNHIDTWIANGVSAGLLGNLSSTMGQALSGRTIRLKAYPFDPRHFGSEGGTGACQFVNDYFDDGTFQFEPITLGGINYKFRVAWEDYDYLSIVIDFADVSAHSEQAYFSMKTTSCRENSLAYGDPCKIFNVVVGWDTCPTPVTSSGGTSGITAPQFDGDIVIQPASGAAWYQCGQNADGTEHTADSQGFSIGFSSGFAGA